MGADLQPTLSVSPPGGRPRDGEGAGASVPTWPQPQRPPWPPSAVFLQPSVLCKGPFWAAGRVREQRGPHRQARPPRRTKAQGCHVPSPEPGTVDHGAPSIQQHQPGLAHSPCQGQLPQPHPGSLYPPAEGPETGVGLFQPCSAPDCPPPVPGDHPSPLLGP